MKKPEKNPQRLAWRKMYFVFYLWVVHLLSNTCDLPLQPDMEPGDVIIVLQQKEHDLFTRSHNDLYMTHSIGLAEALCGFQFVIKHLDGRDLVVSNPPGEVVHPGK